MNENETFVLFDDATQNRAVRLHDFQYQDVLRAQDETSIDECLQRGWQRGFWVAIFADYEFGVPTQKLLPKHEGTCRLLWFAQKQDLDDVHAWLAQQNRGQLAGVSTPEFSVDQKAYDGAISRIHQAIERGDCYQINYTMRLCLQAYGSPVVLYRRLRQAVPYGVLACLPDGAWVLSFSPELFLNVQADGTLISAPMKGTAPRLGNDGDEARAWQLHNDPKNRAENTMIVDLLRNDLGKLATTGGVSVPDPFKVQAFGSVWQMSSQVVAQLPAGTTWSQIMRAVFPCGSITGAPKRKSMEWIQELETTPRGLYTGAIGFLNRENDDILGFSGCLSVVIRTLVLTPQDGQRWQGIYGVGSGIVWDSQAHSEYEECLWKARFIRQLRPECDLFETLLAENKNIALWDRHLARLKHSADALNIPFDGDEVEQAIANILNVIDDKLYKIKLLLRRDGALDSEFAPLAPLSGTQKVVLSDKRLPNRDYLRCHKTTHRQVFDEAWQMAVQQGAFDALLFNCDGFLLEGGRSSVMIRKNNQWFTPPLSLDILPSVARADFMVRYPVVEQAISRAMLEQADEIWLGNALRRWFPVVKAW